MSEIVLPLLPFLVLSFGALFLMLAEAFSPAKGGLALGSTLVFMASAACALGVWMHGLDGLDVSVVAPWLIIDRFTLFFCVILALGGALASLLAGGYLPEHNLDRGEFYSLLLFSTFGAMVLAAAGDLLTVFVGLETMSLGVYALTAFRRASPRSTEGALKYFLLGSFAAALMLYGFALLYGATGTTELEGVGNFLRNNGLRNPLAVMSLVLIVVGLAFKVSAVPFHMWTPDAYEGAPTPATTFMAVVVKAAAFAMMLRMLGTAFNDAGSTSWASGWPPVLAWSAVITMTVANLIAGRQESVKRMLAYSSVAHAGYLLIGVVATTRASEAGASVLFYLLSYTVSTAGAFGALILCGSRGAEAVSFEDLAGIGRRHPAVALPFAFFLFSLAGIPPTAGFFGKWFILKTAMSSGYTWLVLVAMVNSVIAAYYYLRVLVFMYMREPAAGAPLATPMRSGYVTAALVISAFLVVLLGVAPGSSLDFAIEAAKDFATT